MAKYFFDLVGDKKELKDKTGVDLSSDAAAYQEGKLRSINGESFRLQRYSGFTTLIVRNEASGIVAAIPIQKKKG